MTAQRPDGSGLAWAERMYHFLLLLYPRRFRRHWGAEMTHAFHHHRAVHDRRLPFWIWLLFADVIPTAFSAWMTARRVPQYLKVRNGSKGRMPLFPNLVARRVGSAAIDVGFAIRVLRRAPLSTTIAVVTLGLGIGAATTIYSVADAVLLRKLPFDRPHELFNVWHTNPEWRDHPLLSQFWNRLPPSYAGYELWRDGMTAAQGVAVHGVASMALTGTGDPEQIAVGLASVDLFPLLGVRLVIGRSFLPGEQGPGAPRLAVLSNDMWRTRFGSDHSIVGRSISLDDEPYTVIGVMPPGFRLRALVVGGDNDSGERDLWVPVGLQEVEPGRLEAIARLGAGVGKERVQVQMQSLIQDELRSGEGVRLVSRLEDETVESRAGIVLLCGAACLLLLIAGGNLAVLLTGDAIRRRHEMATRAAIGAGGPRLLRQLLTESMVLGLLGAMVGVLLALLGTRLLASLALPVPRAENVQVNLRVLGFAGITGVLSGLVFSILPAWIAISNPLSSLLNAGSNRGGSARGLRLQAGMVTLEVALTVVLLVGGGLLLRSMMSLLAVDPGFDTRNVVAMELALSENRFSSASETSTFYREVLRRVEAVPGVNAVGGVSSLPFAIDYDVATPVYGLDIPGHELEDRDQPLEARGIVVLPGFHETLRIPLVEGRTLDQADGQGSSPAMVINEAMAQRLWPNGSPVGREVILQDRTWTVVGVVGNVKDVGLSEQVQPLFYVFDVQEPMHRMTLVVRTHGRPLDMVPLLRESVWSGYPRVPIALATSMTLLISQSTSEHRYRAILTALFALTAALLAAAGIFGVTAQAVAHRTRELGIRGALGATPSGLLRTVMRDSLAAAVLGTTAGLACALLMSTALSRFLFGVSARDALTYGIVAALALSTCLLASYLPARRVSRVDPMRVLGSE